MKKIFLVLVAMTALLSAKQNDFDVNELQNRCNNNDATGCLRLGVAYDFGEGVRQDYKKASELYSKACDLGFDRGCFNLGVLYTYGQGVKQDKSTAKEYFGKACDLGDQLGCDEYKKLNEQGF